MRKLNSILIAVMLSASLAGCANFAANVEAKFVETTDAVFPSKSSIPAQNTPSSSPFKCPPLTSYSSEQAKAIGAELQTLPADSALALYATDARNLRIQCGAK